MAPSVLAMAAHTRIMMTKVDSQDIGEDRTLMNKCPEALLIKLLYQKHSQKKSYGVSA